MISRRGSIIRAVVTFGSIAAGALVWGYSRVDEQRLGGSVEVQQLQEPAWGVEVQELSAEAGAVAGTAKSPILVAQRPAARQRSNPE